jgi:signal transduction histidine kinase
MTVAAIAKLTGEAIDEFDPSELVNYITVEDNGIGIKKEKLLLIFRPYTQVKSARVNVTPGASASGDQEDVGMGLFTVKRLMEAHRGTVFATSDGTSGTKFHLLFPPEPRLRMAPTSQTAEDD